jgi:hypothetical protein
MAKKKSKPRFTKRLVRAALRLGDINASELARAMRGLPSRERPPGLLAAQRELAAARKAAGYEDDP